MANYDASIKKALRPEQDDLIDHGEHCSADPDKLATIGRARRHQIRIRRDDHEYGLFTVCEVRQENPDNSFAWAKAAGSDSVRARVRRYARLAGAPSDLLRR